MLPSITTLGGQTLGASGRTEPEEKHLLRTISLQKSRYSTMQITLYHSSIIHVIKKNIILIGLIGFLYKPAIAQKATSVNVKLLIDSLTYKIEKNYILNDKALLINAYLKKQYEAKAYDKISNPFQLGDLIMSDINKVYNDKHFGMRYIPANPNQPTEEERQKRIATIEKDNNYMFKKLEILTGGISYLRLDAFATNVVDAKPTLESALSFLKNTKAIIIDLRYNRGGNPEMVKQMESYFFKEKIHTIDAVTTQLKDTVKFYTDPESTNGLFLSMPVYILTSRNTSSGAEDFSYAMSNLKRAKLVGDTTSGAANGAIPFSVGQGFQAFIPIFRPISPITLKDWEGTGVYPNVYAKSEKAFEKAQQIAIQDLLNEAKSDKEKNVYQWLLNDLKANSNDVFVDVKNMEQCVGTFKGLNFYIEKGSLTCKNAERGNSIYKLKPINDMLYVLDENVQVEFVKSAKGKVSGIKMYWKQGNITEKEID